VRREKEESTGKDQVHQVCFSFCWFSSYIHTFIYIALKKGENPQMILMAYTSP